MTWAKSGCKSPSPTMPPPKRRPHTSQFQSWSYDRRYMERIPRCYVYRDNIFLHLEHMRCRCLVYSRLGQTVPSMPSSLLLPDEWYINPEWMRCDDMLHFLAVLFTAEHDISRVVQHHLVWWTFFESRCHFGGFIVVFVIMPDNDRCSLALIWLAGVILSARWGYIVYLYIWFTSAVPRSRLVKRKSATHREVYDCWSYQVITELEVSRHDGITM